MPRTTVAVTVDTDDPELQGVLDRVRTLPEWSRERVYLVAELMRNEADRIVREYLSANDEPASTSFYGGGRHRSAD